MYNITISHSISLFSKIDKRVLTKLVTQCDTLIIPGI